VREAGMEVGAPVSFDEELPRSSALECALGALGAEASLGLATLAHRKGLQIEHVESVVRAQLANPLVALGVVGETGDPGFERISITTFVTSPESEVAIQDLWEIAKSRAPLLHTFGRACALETKLEFVL